MNADIHTRTASVSKPWFLVWFVLCLLPGMAHAVSRIDISIGDIQYDDTSARNLSLSLGLNDSALRLHADELSAQGQHWRDVTLHCPRTTGEVGRAFACERATLTSGKNTLPVFFALDLPRGRLELRLLPEKTEVWALQGQWGQGAWQAEAKVTAGSLQRMQAWLAPWVTLPVSPSQGVIEGSASLQGGAAGMQKIKASVDVSALSFSDAEGLHAGEKVAGGLSLEASKTGAAWHWSSALAWREGEVFWQPLYFASGGHQMKADGTWQGDLLQVNHGELGMQGVGALAFSGTLQTAAKRLQNLQIEARGLQAGKSYEWLLKPFLEKTMLGSLEMAGRIDASVQWRDERLQAFDVALHEFDVEDKRGRFALYKVNAHVPWTLSNATQASLRYAGGHLLKMPLGATDLAAVLNGYSLTAPVLRLPVLDGALSLKDVSAAFLQNQWHWHLGAEISPLSMADFSHAVGWPIMRGQAAASIPMVTYSGGRMSVEGGMEFKVFDGNVKINNLALQDPLGLAPRLQADISLRNLDLELLTSTYSFGAMTGRLDGDVNGMVLSRWQPVQFDAAFYSSPGSYPRKISQRAVENISSLGGAGATAAIQRSFLRFFKEFNYDRIGLSCKLRNGVCAMDGVEPAQSGYVIVKGRGVPSITVLGYNRSVSWGEFLQRVQRVTQGNKPVIN